MLLVSASQFGAWECIRQGAGRYIWGHKPLFPPVHFAFGSKFHSHAEAYLKDEELAEEDEVCATMLNIGMYLLPDPGTVEVEQYFKFELIPATEGLQSVWMCGYKDFCDPGVMVGDHKTTGGWRTETSESLPKNRQALIYAHDEFLKHPDAEVILAQWIYYHKKPPHRAWAVKADISRAMAADAVEALLPRARMIQGIREHITKADPFNDLPCDLTACGGSGKWCDSADQCDRSEPGITKPQLEQLIQLRRSGP